MHTNDFKLHFTCIFSQQNICYNNNSIILFVFVSFAAFHVMYACLCVYYESMYEQRKCATSLDLSLTWVKHTVMQGLCELQRSVVSCFMALLPAGGQPFTIFCPAPWFTGARKMNIWRGGSYTFLQKPFVLCYGPVLNSYHKFSWKLLQNWCTSSVLIINTKADEI